MLGSLISPRWRQPRNLPKRAELADKSQLGTRPPKLGELANLRFGLCSVAIGRGAQGKEQAGTMSSKIHKSLRRIFRFSHSLTVTVTGVTIVFFCRLDELWCTFTPGKSSRMQQKRFTQNHRIMFVISVLKIRFPNLIGQFYLTGTVLCKMEIFRRKTCIENYG